MLFPALKFFEWRQMWILVIERDDQPGKYLVICSVIQKATAFRVIIQRPAGGVYDETLFMLLRIDVPDFLEADAVMLRVRVGAQIKLAT